MPRKTKKKKCCRGRGLKDWIKSAHNSIRSSGGYTSAANHVYKNYGKDLINKKFGKFAPFVHQGVADGLAKLKQSGYGIRHSGSGIRRSGMGIRRAGLGIRHRLVQDTTRLKY